MVNKFYQNLPTTIFEEMSSLARELGAINLGQGFPDDKGDEVVRKMTAEYSMNGHNQYPSAKGIPELREAFAEHEKHFYNIDRNVETEIVITSGGTEALASSIFALLEEGDEAIIFAPFYDAYEVMMEKAGAKPVIVPLKPSTWEIDFAALEQAITKNTKVILINSPHNPTGALLSRGELEKLGDIAQKHDINIISDEVYEHLTFDGIKHISACEIESLKNRTVKISSAGKIFSLTGFKIGMITAPEHLMKVILKAHQYLTFTTPPNSQYGVAMALKQGDEIHEHRQNEYQKGRDFLYKGLVDLGYNVIQAKGGYFVTVDLTGTEWENRDREFAMHLAHEKKVVTVPVSPFYGYAPKTDYLRNKNFLRFCFVKNQNTLEMALERLGK